MKTRSKGSIPTAISSSRRIVGIPCRSIYSRMAFATYGRKLFRSRSRATGLRAAAATNIRSESKFFLRDIRSLVFERFPNRDTGIPLVRTPQRSRALLLFLAEYVFHKRPIRFFGAHMRSCFFCY
uniref:Uncharacterized protein n=1 Tax=mine drainage metagenome TaxID=410659 RepID=E6Q5R3_9ZZZZ